MAIKIPKALTRDFVELREGIANCISALNTGAIVHNNWIMQSDIEDTLNMLEDANGKVHGWMVSIDSVEPTEPRTGVNYIEYDINVRIWGLMGYYYEASRDSAQSILEKECRDVIRVILLNRSTLGMDDTTPIPIKPIDSLPRFEDIDVKAFGRGSDVIVAQGNLRVIWTEVTEEE